VSDGGGLGGLQVGVVGRERVSGRGGVPRERGGLVGERLVQLPRSCSRSQTEPDAKGLATWPPRAQPSRRRGAHAPLELGLARIEGVTERRVPRELVAGNRVQLEQPSHECPRFFAGQVAALDQGDSMREIRQRQAAGEPRAMCALGGVGSGHELACSTAPQPPASAELPRLRHHTETSARCPRAAARRAPESPR
jgi:hypothetical protein